LKNVLEWGEEGVGMEATQLAIQERSRLAREGAGAIPHHSRTFSISERRGVPADAQGEEG